MSSDPFANFLGIIGFGGLMLFVGLVGVWLDEEMIARKRKRERKSLLQRFPKMSKAEALTCISEQFKLDLLALRLQTEGPSPPGLRPANCALRSRVGSLLQNFDQAISAELRDFEVLEDIAIQIQNLSRKLSQASELDAYDYRLAQREILTARRRGCPEKTIKEANELADATRYAELRELIWRYLPDLAHSGYDHPY
ncbi:MAG: hypothetical protein K2X27_24315 [Candidatus Obscuribacterales bacterium]|nr:hypothetical protein [Candidatus Obscuribacterales bacterium]